MASPDTFPQSNKRLGPPKGHDHSAIPCDSLDIYSDGEVCVSRWKLTWRERIHALLFGTAWVWVIGANQPPVALDLKRTVFIPS
jgi:hypothetical protein